MIAYKTCINNSFLEMSSYGKIGNRMKDILVEQLECNRRTSPWRALLVDDLGADSLDAIDIVMSVEDTFKVEVPD